MLVLGIETSCDETSVALLRYRDSDDREDENDGFGRAEIVANLIASQIEWHQQFGGVVPEIASRRHLAAFNPLLAQLRAECDLDWREVDLIGVTHGPGLAGALLVGVAGAKALSYAHQIPCVPVNHVAGHVASTWLTQPDLQLPMLCVVVSGGHSDLLLLRERGQFERLGRTRDDALGEAFDKVARKLGLPLPGGPALEKLAQAGDEKAFRFTPSNLEPSFDVSYSGLKTAAAQQIQKTPERLADIAASFQRVAVLQLRRAVERALQEHRPKTLGVCGGVAANGYLRAQLNNLARENEIEFVVPDTILCTDNAAMIAAQAREVWLARPEAEQIWNLKQLDFEARSLLPVA